MNVNPQLSEWERDQIQGMIEIALQKERNRLFQVIYQVCTEAAQPHNLRYSAYYWLEQIKNRIMSTI